MCCAEERCAEAPRSTEERCVELVCCVKEPRIFILRVEGLCCAEERCAEEPRSTRAIGGGTKSRSVAVKRVWGVSTTSADTRRTGK